MIFFKGIIGKHPYQWFPDDKYLAIKYYPLPPKTLKPTAQTHLKLSDISLSSFNFRSSFSGY
jgi:hypothetical protein